MKLDRIKPAQKNVSDKYSISLYKFLDKQFRQRDYGKYVKKQLRIYFLKRSRWDGSILEFDPKKSLQIGQTIISPFGEGSFFFMSDILGDRRKTEFAMVFNKEELVDITDWFFSTYERIGRCVFDLEHGRWWKGDNKRFTYVNNTRKCNWCGEWHTKEIRKEVSIKRLVNWV